MRPKVSVIIPCYNYDKYIEQCLLSVIVQRTTFPIEIVIGDDNSTDNSFHIANRVKSLYENNFIQFKIYKNSENLGEVKNTKKLLENSIGQYVAYLDADDYWITPDKLQKQVDFMDKNPNCAMCVTGYISLENGNFVPTNDLSYWLCILDKSSESLTKINKVGSSSSRLFRNYNNLIKDYFIHFPFSDWPLNFELSLLGDIEYLDYPTYIYRIHDNSLSKAESHLEKNELDELHNKRCNILESILEDFNRQKFNSHLTYNI